MRYENATPEKEFEEKRKVKGILGWTEPESFVASICRYWFLFEKKKKIFTSVSSGIKGSQTRN